MKVLFGFGLSSLLTSGLRALSLPLMGWLVAPEVFAAFNLWQIVLAVCILLAGLGLSHAVTRDFYATPEHEQPTLILQVLLSKMAAVLLLGTLFAIVGVFASLFEKIPRALLAQDALLLAVCYLFAAGVLQSFYTTATQYLRLRQAAGAFAIVEIGGRLLWLVALATVWWFEGASISLITLLSIWLAVLFLNCVVLLILVQKVFFTVLKNSDNFFQAYWHGKIWQMLRYGRPVLLSEFFYWCLTASGAFLLSIWHGLSTLALFTMAIAIGSLGSMLGQVFNTVWLPEVYRSFGQNSDLPWLSGAALTITWLTVGCVLAAGVGGFLVTMLLPAHYAGISGLVMAAFCKPMLMSLQRVTAIGIELRRATWISPILMLSALALQFLLASWLIPVYAAHGAMVSLLLSTWFFWQGKSIASARQWRPVGGLAIYLPIFCVVMAAATLALVTSPAH